MNNNGYQALCGVADLADSTALLTQIRRHLHQHPELSFKEAATAELVASHLGAWGYEVTRDVGGHGVVGTLGRGAGGRCISLRADIFARIVPLAAVPVVLLGLGLGSLYSRHAERQAVERLDEQAVLVGRRIHDYLEMHATAVASLSQRLDETSMGTPAGETALLEQHQLHDGFLTMLVADATGELRAGSSRLNYSARPAVSARLTERTPAPP